MSKRLILAALVTAMSLSSAHAVVVSNTKISLTPTTAYGANYAITANQSATFDDFTTMWFTKQDGSDTSTLTPVTWNVDQEADYYLVDAGATFAPDSIAAGQFKPWFTLDHAYTLDVARPLIAAFDIGDFYLGVATTGPGPMPDGTPRSGFADRNVFGWVHLRNDSRGLSILGSAMAYGEGGIIVGTTTAVPEPGTFLLSAIGLAGLAFVRRRRSL